MGQRLIALPITVGFRAARLGLRAARLPLDVLGALLGRGNGDSPEPAWPEPEEEASRAAPPVRPAPPAERAAPEPPAADGGPVVATALDGGAVTAEDAEPVAEEPEVVAESTDPGAEDGAGAEIDVAEPWDGYARMTARDIERRVATATAEEVAVVRLYETTHKRRQSVLRATEGRMNQQAAERRRPR